jgi:hypothetical protein
MTTHRHESVQEATALKAQLRTFQMLVMTGLAHRDVVAALVTERAAATHEWAWQRQLRHYWDQDASACSIAVGDAAIAYGWEFHGGARLTDIMLLPYTERSVLTACMALHADVMLSLVPDSARGGLPTHEYAAALAYTFGRLLLTCQCTRATTHLHLTRSLQV